MVITVSLPAPPVAMSSSYPFTLTPRVTAKPAIPAFATADVISTNELFAHAEAFGVTETAAAALGKHPYVHVSELPSHDSAYHALTLTLTVEE